MPYNELRDKAYIERKIFRGLLEQLIMYTFGKIFMRQSIIWGIFCDWVQGVKRFSTDPVASLIKYLPWAEPQDES